jgi:predicted nucleic acid-binding Zn ribbon protein
VTRVLFAPAIHFKGSGFHNTDYGTKRRGAGDDSGGAGPGSGDASSNGGAGSERRAADKPAAATAGSSGGTKTVGLDKV